MLYSTIPYYTILRLAFCLRPNACCRVRLARGAFFSRGLAQVYVYVYVYAYYIYIYIDIYVSYIYNVC